MRYLRQSGQHCLERFKDAELVHRVTLGNQAATKQSFVLGGRKASWEKAFWEPAGRQGPENSFSTHAIILYITVGLYFVLQSL